MGLALGFTVLVVGVLFLIFSKQLSKILRPTGSLWNFKKNLTTEMGEKRANLLVKLIGLAIIALSIPIFFQ